MADIYDCVRSLVPGRARLRHPMLYRIDAESAAEVTDMLLTLPGVTGATINPRVGSLLLEWDVAQTDDKTLLGLIESYAAMMGLDDPTAADDESATKKVCACECAAKVQDAAEKAVKAVDAGAAKVFGEVARLVMPALHKHSPNRAARTLQNRSMLALLLVSVGALYWRSTQLRTHVWAGGAFLALLGLHLLQHRRVL